MNVSLFDKALPSHDHEEGKRFFKPLSVPSKGHPNGHLPYFNKFLVLGQLILEKCQETTEAIIDATYKKFDAMVMNHGCQITALQNHRLIKTEGLLEEARKVHDLAIVQLARINDFLIHASSKDPVYAGKRKLGMNVFDYLKEYEFDIEISLTLAQLVRFRILHSINGLEQDEIEEFSRKQLQKKQSEEPFTCYAPLENRVTQIFIQNRLLGNSKQAVNIKSWIRCLQIEEAQEAVTFIKAVADENPSKVKELLLKSLSAIKEGSHGERLPQLYTGEVAINGVEGIVLIKNKRKYNGRVRPETSDIRVFLKMPEGRIMSAHEVQKIPDEESIVVLEGYIFVGEDLLQSKVAELGVSTLLKATLALSDVAPQDSYTLHTTIDSFTEKRLKELEEENGDINLQTIIDALHVVKFDHMYCNSIREERSPINLAGDDQPFALEQLVQHLALTNHVEGEAK